MSIKEHLTYCKFSWQNFILWSINLRPRSQQQNRYSEFILYFVDVKKNTRTIYELVKIARRFEWSNRLRKKLWATFCWGLILGFIISGCRYAENGKRMFLHTLKWASTTYVFLLQGDECCSSEIIISLTVCVRKSSFRKKIRWIETQFCVVYVITKSNQIHKESKGTLTLSAQTRPSKYQTSKMLLTLMHSSFE